MAVRGLHLAPVLKLQRIASAATPRAARGHVAFDAQSALRSVFTGLNGQAAPFSSRCDNLRWSIHALEWRPWRWRRRGDGRWWAHVDTRACQPCVGSNSRTRSVAIMFRARHPSVARIQHEPARPGSIGITTCLRDSSLEQHKKQDEELLRHMACSRWSSMPRGACRGRITGDGKRASDRREVGQAECRQSLGSRVCCQRILRDAGSGRRRQRAAGDERVARSGPNSRGSHKMSLSTTPRGAAGPVGRLRDEEHHTQHSDCAHMAGRSSHSCSGGTDIRPIQTQHAPACVRARAAAAEAATLTLVRPSSVIGIFSLAPRLITFMLS